MVIFICYNIIKGGTIMIYILIYGAVAIFLFLYWLLVVKPRNKSADQDAAKFIQNNPGAVKVYSTMSSTLGNQIDDLLSLSHDIFIEQINNQYPVRFTEKLGAGYGVYAKPGKNTIVVIARSKGKKRVSNRTYGPLELTFEANPGKEYLVSLIDKEFKITEI